MLLLSCATPPLVMRVGPVGNGIFWDIPRMEFKMLSNTPTIVASPAVMAPTMLAGPMASGISSAVVCAATAVVSSRTPAPNSMGPRYGPSATIVSLTKCTACSTPPTEALSRSQFLSIDSIVRSVESFAISCRLESVPGQSSTPGQSLKKHRQHFPNTL